MGRISDNRFKFSLNAINNLDDSTNGKARVNYKDLGCSELTLSILKSGEKIYCVFYRVYRNGTYTNAYYKIGNYRNFTVDDAREIARECVKYGKEGWDYAVYKQQQANIESIAANKEQIESSNFELGNLAGQLGFAWRNHISHKVGLTRRTMQKYKNQFTKHIFGFFGEKTFCSDITEKQCLDFKKHMEDKKTQFNRIRGELVSMFDREILENRLTRNMMRSVKQYTEKVNNAVLTDKGVLDCYEFFSDLSKFKAKEHNYIRFLLVQLTTGMRPVVLRSLEKTDNGDNNFVDWSASKLIIRKHKTDKKSNLPYQSINVIPEVLEILKAASAANPKSKYAIPSLDPRPGYSWRQISEDRPREIFNQYSHLFESEGVGKLNCYRLRHSFATQLLKRDVPLHVVGAMLGHAPGSTATARYARILEHTKLNAVAVAADIFRKNNEVT